MYKYWIIHFLLLLYMNTIIIFSLLIVVAHSLPNGLSIDIQLNGEWEMFKTKFGKTYKNTDEYARRLIWEQNVKYIQEHNIRYDLGEHSYFLGINQFTDLTHEEFKTKYLSFGIPVKLNNTVKFTAPLNMGQLPASVNWVTKGYVTSVKNQYPNPKRCGCCYAISAVGSLEGQYFRKNKKLVSLSVQQLIDCSTSFGNTGCDGGEIINSFQYVSTFGIESDQEYPFIVQDGNCQYNVDKVVTHISSFSEIYKGSEEDLAWALALQGPISVAIDASRPSFQFYKGGVYNELICSTDYLDHAVLAVGYGVEKKDKYWLVKNSYGTHWGAKGYIKMSKDKNNQCGIATKASFPII